MQDAITMTHMTACSPEVAPGLPELLLWKSATVVGFFLLHYAPMYKKHLARLVDLWQSGRLHISIDARSFRCAPLRLSASHTVYGRLHLLKFSAYRLFARERDWSCCTILWVSRRQAGFDSVNW